jgi:hypothetical protein
MVKCILYNVIATFLRSSFVELARIIKILDYITHALQVIDLISYDKRTKRSKKRHYLVFYIIY